MMCLSAMFRRMMLSIRSTLIGGADCWAAAESEAATIKVAARRRVRTIWRVEVSEAKIGAEIRRLASGAQGETCAGSAAA